MFDAALRPYLDKIVDPIGRMVRGARHLGKHGHRCWFCSAALPPFSLLSWE